MLFRRPESVIQHDFLEDEKNFPAGLKLGDALATWEGSIESGTTGRHHFLLRNAGYAKRYFDGKLVVDKWRQARNPGTALVPLDLLEGRRYTLKLEWNPDGGESYVGLQWLSPLVGAAQNEYSFRSEAGPGVNYCLVQGTPDEAVSGYGTFTGPAPIVPKWALGFWQSWERYKTQQEPLDVAAEIRKRQIPIDNVVLDWSHWKPDAWGSQGVDPSRFLDPDGLIKTLHERDHLHFMISVWPKFYEGAST